MRSFEWFEKRLACDVLLIHRHPFILGGVWPRRSAVGGPSQLHPPCHGLSTPGHGLPTPSNRNWSQVLEIDLMMDNQPS